MFVCNFIMETIRLASPLWVEKDENSKHVLGKIINGNIVTAYSDVCMQTMATY